MSITADGEASSGFSEYRRSAGFLLARLGGLAERQWNRHLKAHELTQSEFAVLAVLPARKGLRQSDVAARAGIDPRNAVAVIGALQKRGLVASRPDPEDGRAKMLKISRLGSQLLNRLHAKLAPEREEFFAALSPSEYSTLCSLLERVYRERQAQTPSRR